MRQQKNLFKVTDEGFTLIEVLMVIAIIGLLANMIIMVQSNIRDKAKDTTRVASVKQVGKALELYLASNNSYPIALTPTISIPGITPDYLSALPTPITPPATGCDTTHNQYLYQSDGKSFGIFFCIGTPVGSVQPGYKIFDSDIGFTNRYDINADGIFDSNDPLYISQSVVGLKPPCFSRCDITKDGAVNSFDAGILSQILAGIIDGYN